jgi:hypothetical protein
VNDSPPNHEWLKIKSAIWAAANIALCHEGVLVIEREGAINAIVNIAEKSQVFSLRGTAFYALGLVATTRYVISSYHFWEMFSKQFQFSCYLSDLSLPS